MTPDDLSDLLRNARNAAGITQEALAAAAGVEVATLRAWENGYNLERIAKFFQAVELTGRDWATRPRAIEAKHKARY